MAEAEIPLAGGADSNVVRIGATVRREARSWSPAVLDLLRHVERQGFAGAPRAFGFDHRGREILGYIEGEVGLNGGIIPEEGGRFGFRLPEFIWRDDVLVHLGALLRGYHDAAASFPWAERDWRLEPHEPVETICHNDLTPWNTVFRAGQPVAFIDWDAAAPGPRAWDIGFMAWRWVPFWRDEKCRAHGLPTGVADKVRRYRLLLGAYGIEADIDFVRIGLERLRQFHAHIRQLVADGSEWQAALAQRGIVDEEALEIAWVEQHAAALAGL